MQTFHLRRIRRPPGGLTRVREANISRTIASIATCAYIINHVLLELCLSRVTASHKHVYLETNDNNLVW